MMAAAADSELERVHSGIAEAARLARRAAEDVTLIAVSKTQPAERIVPLLEAGHRHFGENRVQEAAAKWPELNVRWPDARLHLIGQLQSNKAEQAVALFDAIHSLDRSSLISALGAAMAKAGRTLPCFIQVNLADEPQKGGCSVAALPDLIAGARSAGIPLAGLMCIPPADREPAPWFAMLAELARRHDLSGLSMGMSSDFETAVAIGATHVRVGTALFGARETAA